MLAPLILIALISGALFLLFNERHLGIRLLTFAIVGAVVAPLISQLGGLIVATLAPYWWLALIIVPAIGIGLALMHHHSQPTQPERTSLKQRIDHDG